MEMTPGPHREAVTPAEGLAPTEALAEAFTHKIIQHVIKTTEMSKTTTAHFISETTTARLIGANVHDASVDDGSFEAIVGGCVSAVILVLLCAAVLVLRYMFKHKGSYLTNESEEDVSLEDVDGLPPTDQALLETVYEE